MYRIMLVAKEGTSEINNLYKYFTVSNTEGKIIPFEAETLEELDVQVEKMLNGDYRKKDILIVQSKDFSIEADLFVKTESENTENISGSEEQEVTS